MMFVDIFTKNDYDDYDIFINIEREVYSESKEGEHGRSEERRVGKEC